MTFFDVLGRRIDFHCPRLMRPSRDTHIVRGAKQHQAVTPRPFPPNQIELIPATMLDDKRGRIPSALAPFLAVHHLATHQGPRYIPLSQTQPSCVNHGLKPVAEGCMIFSPRAP